jgi:hypothetical protein
LEVSGHRGDSVLEAKVRTNVWDIGLSVDPQQQFAFLIDGTNQQVYILDRKSLKVLDTFGGAGHWAEQFYGAHNLAVNSKGDLFITETYEGKRVQRFVQVQTGTRTPQ